MAESKQLTPEQVLEYIKKITPAAEPDMPGQIPILGCCTYVSMGHMHQVTCDSYTCRNSYKGSWFGQPCAHPMDE